MPRCREVSVAVPSSTMLFGEHAVLRGKHAMVAAIDRFLSVRLTPRTDDIVEIISQGVVYRTVLQQPAFSETLRFVRGVVLSYLPFLDGGVSIRIASEIPQTVGLASSAAVTAALVGAFEAYLRGHDIPLDDAQREKITRRARDIVRSVQGGRGSGADIASVVYGGVISYTAEPLYVEKIAESLPLSLVYSGSKTPTPAVIEQVDTLHQKFPNIFERLFDAMEATTVTALEACRRGDLQTLGVCMNIAQGQMESLQVSTRQLSDILWSLRSIQGVYGAKISGSGLGDSMVALGEVGAVACGELLPVRVTPKGLMVEAVYA